jgi:predicted DNA-binding transcriptional regulator YafY
MTHLEFSKKLKILQNLTNVGKTGSPKEIGQRLNVSDKTVRRMINVLRDTGVPIMYCRKFRTYKAAPVEDLGKTDCK